MNWDWDKLQEKRQRNQNGWTVWSNPNDDKSKGSPPNGSNGNNGGNHGGGGDNGNNNNNNNRNSGGNNIPPFNFSKAGDSFNKLVPKKAPIKLIALALVIIWLLSGIYIVQPDEQGVVTRFGAYTRTVEPGPHYALPYPIETVYKPKVTQVRRAEIGFRSQAAGLTYQQGKSVLKPDESAMLTGDENIVEVQFNVQYQIKDPVEYLFNVADPAVVVQNAAEAAMREVMGNSKIDSALTDGKLVIQNEATQLLQTIIDRYKVGIRIIAVQLQDVQPPKEVVEAFKDVASAREDKSRIINEAEAYRNEVIPQTRGLAAEIINQAEAYRQTRVQGAMGESERFLAVLFEYNKAPEITKKRLTLETMEQILSRPELEKLIIPSSSAQNILPLLPLTGNSNNSGLSTLSPENVTNISKLQGVR